MRIDQQRLIVLALAVVREAVDACAPAPIKPSLALRFALRFLWAHSKGPKFPYDDFLEAIQDRGLPNVPEGQQRYRRFSGANSGLKGIIRSVGMPETVTFEHLLAALADVNGARQRYRVAASFRQAQDDRIALDKQRRRGRECDLSG